MSQTRFWRTNRTSARITIVGGDNAAELSEGVGFKVSFMCLILLSRITSSDYLYQA
jgi:hypothetical protein